MHEVNHSIFHKVNDDLSAGVQFAADLGLTATKFGMGAQYALDENTSVRGKISNDCLIGTFCIQMLRFVLVHAVIDVTDSGAFHTLSYSFRSWIPNQNP